MLAGTDLDDARSPPRARTSRPLGVEADARARRRARTRPAPATSTSSITNPPLGSRVQVDAAALLVAVLPVIARRLARGGRLVWITPAPQQTTRVAEGLGLRRTFHTAIDLGGVHGRLERWQR